ncbi:hypothetical protein WIS52_27840 [Pseudonocardia nematodicida]|uniref:Uncharacterized protein n=1 Tax=Pseudonocardia nematodicida TaxID=1206997 RepID=A0ABV1KIM0_9PSEU
MWNVLERWIGRFRRPPVEDVEPDPNLANSRAIGGADTERGDSAATTGTGRSGEFVGRVAGRDEGYAGETGAEARAEAGEATAGADGATGDGAGGNRARPDGSVAQQGHGDPPRPSR